MNQEAPVTTSAIPQPLSPGRRVVTLLSAARSEILLAQIGLVVIAIHVIDDNFVQPQPGTSAGDHLVSGLVPTTALLCSRRSTGICAPAFERRLQSS